jgi:hypothetical protein
MLKVQNTPLAAGVTGTPPSSSCFLVACRQNATTSERNGFDVNGAGRTERPDSFSSFDVREFSLGAGASAHRTLQASLILSQAKRLRRPAGELSPNLGDGRGQAAAV